jgi:hypothetical protein
VDGERAPCLDERLVRVDVDPRVPFDEGLGHVLPGHWLVAEVQRSSDALQQTV